MVEMAKSLEKLKGLEFPMFDIKSPIASPKVHKIVADADEVIGDFLKNFGL